MQYRTDSLTRILVPLFLSPSALDSYSKPNAPGISTLA